MSGQGAERAAGSAPDDTAPSGSTASPVLLKAFDVLGAFSHDRRVLTLAEISRRSGLPKSTVHRMLATLVPLGAVERADGGYRMGLRMFSLGALPPEAALREAAMVHLEELHRVTGQTLHLAILRGSDVVYLEKLPGRKGIATPAMIGDRLPATCTAVGKAILAFSADGHGGAACAPLHRRTASSVGSRAELASELEAIRRRGYATDREESAAGLACVAVPLLAGSRVVAAISVAFPAPAGDGQVLVGPLRQTAAAISRTPVVLNRL